MKKMKYSGITITFLILCAVVLVASLGLGLYIREVRFRRARSTAIKSADLAQLPGHGISSREAELSEEDRALRKEQRRRIVEEMASSSEEQQEQFRNRMRDNFMPDQEILNQQLENMSEQERQQYISEGMARFGSGRQGSRQTDRMSREEEQSPEQEFMPEDELTSEDQDVSQDELVPDDQGASQEQDLQDEESTPQEEELPPEEEITTQQ